MKNSAKMFVFVFISTDLRNVVSRDQKVIIGVGKYLNNTVRVSVMKSHLQLNLQNLHNQHITTLLLGTPNHL